MKQGASLSRRERQIMDVLFRTGKATAQEVLDQLPDPPSYSAVRALLRILEEKGHVRHQVDGQRYVFTPVTPAGAAKRHALRHMLETFFAGSVEQAVAALLDAEARRLSPDELDRLQHLIEQARKKEV